MARDDPPADTTAPRPDAVDPLRDFVDAPTRAFESVPVDTDDDRSPMGQASPGDDPSGEAQHAIMPGTEVDNFKVLRPIGRGGMGEVFLARDRSLGRMVALKVLHRKAIGSPEAVERFLFEARATAQFNFPHIITIHAVGEHEGHPYVALEYLQGQTLRERLQEERLGQREALRIGLAIAEALQEAHRHQLLHRDLKPANVMIPRDGRIRVLDFGLAKAVTAEALDDPHLPDDALHPTDDDGALSSKSEGVRGTPAYMPPEQWNGQQTTGATDVWALGMILHEMLAGSHPLSDHGFVQLYSAITGPDPIPELPGDVPRPLARLVGGCLSKDAQRRPEIARVVSTLRDLLGGERAPHTEDRCPFRGLQAFAERHSEQFYGRQTEIGIFMERLRDEAVLPVIGPSGAGKSSFVQAGVIPRIREQGRWLFLKLRPGRQPFRSLAARLISGAASRSSSLFSATMPGGNRVGQPKGVEGEAGEDLEQITARLREELDASPTTLALWLARLAEAEQTRVLLFVDQLEELHTLVEDADDRRCFMEALCRAADDPQGPVRVIFTLRDDYLGRLAVGPASREVLSRVTVLNTPGREALQEICTRPVTTAGYGYDDPQLVRRMVDAVAGEPSALPLLQFAGRMLWEKRDRARRFLCQSVYEEFGGVEGALAHHADGILDALPPQQLRVAKALFLRLVTADETRRVTPRGALLEGLGSAAEGILDRLVSERLILVRKARGLEALHSFDGVSTTVAGDAEMELVHESLIRTWSRLSHWIEESREEMVFLAQISQAAELWDRRGRHTEEVWLGDALRDALRLARRFDPIPRLVRQFLAAGAAKDRWKRRRNQGIVTTVLVVTVLVAMILAVQTREARQQRSLAETQRAEVQRESARASVMREDLLEARAKLRASIETQDSPLARALWWQVKRFPLQWKRDLGGVVYDVAFSPDGSTVAGASHDGAIYLFDTQTRAARVLRGHVDQVLTVDFGPEGRTLVSGTLGGEMGLWDLVDHTKRFWDGGTSKVRATCIAPDGQHVASGGQDHVVRIWDRSTGELQRELVGHQGVIRGLRYSHDGRVLASSSSDHSVCLWDPHSGVLLHELTGHQTDTYGIDFSPDGATLASIGYDNTVRLWDVASGEERQQYRAVHTHQYVRELRYSPDGSRLAVVSNDNSIRLLDAHDGTELHRLPGHDERIRGLAFSPDGHSLVSGGFDFLVQLWDLDALVEDAAIDGHRLAVYGVQFSPDGAVIASGSMDRTIRLWDAATGQVTGVLEGHEATVETVRFHPDGALLASAAADGNIRIWDWNLGTTIREFHGHSDGVWDVAFSPDGKLLASGGADRTVRIWNAETGGELHQLKGEYYPGGVSFSPEGRRLASGGDGGTIRIWDVASGALQTTLTAETTIASRGVRFSPDGRSLATGGNDGSIRLWDLEGGHSRVLDRIDARIYWLDFSPDGRLLGVPSSDGTVRIWDLETGQMTQLRGHRSEVNWLDFSGDGERIATSSDDGTVRVWRTDSARLLWRAPALLSSPTELLTHQGWQTVTPDGSPPPPTAWRDELERSARFASVSADGSNVCASTVDGKVQIWDRTRDERLVARAAPPVADLQALDNGCLVLIEGGEVKRLDPSGSWDTLHVGGTAIARSGSDILVAAGPEVFVHAGTGELLSSHPADVGVTALSRIGSRLLLGYREGRIEQLSTPSDPVLAREFEDVPASAVVRLIPGPMGTVIAGYASGDLGIWSLDDGVRLYGSHLHGPLVHLQQANGELHVASELGWSDVLDLGVFEMDYCDLMREVWAAVPVVWENGRPVPREPPATHRCQP